MFNKMLKLITKFILITTIILSSNVIANDITFGAVVSLSGKYSTSGKHVQRGYDLAIQHINNSGGININGKKHKLEIIYYDDTSDKETAKLFSKKLIIEDKVDFMLGPYGSNITAAIAPITEKYKIPMIEANGASSSLFDNNYKYMFAVLSTAQQYLQEAVKQISIKSHKADKDIKVAIAVNSDAGTQDVRAGVVGLINKKGMQIIIDDTIENNEEDITNTLIKIKKQKPDLLVFSNYAKGAQSLIKKMHE